MSNSRFKNFCLWLISRFQFNEEKRFYSLLKRGYYDDMSDEECIKRQFYYALGYPLNLDNPQTFCEKVNWLKLYDHNSSYPELVDKYLAKKHVADIIGEEHIIPLLGKWDRFDDIDFEKLPNQFVLKCNHDSGSWVIVKDKNRFDAKAKATAKKRLENSLKRNYFLVERGWAYKGIQPCIIAEQYLCNPDYHWYDRLRDYKFFCFDGEPKIFMVGNDTETHEWTDFFDMDYNVLKVHMLDPNSENPFPKPSCFEEMKELARKLSKGIPQVRVDFYYANNTVYFGEMTFYSHGGFVPFKPEKWERIVGSWIKLPEKRLS